MPSIGKSDKPSFEPVESVPLPLKKPFAKEFSGTLFNQSYFFFGIKN